MPEEERVDRLLEQKGIAPEDISYVILSHLHPDHIGGAAFFQGSLHSDQDRFQNLSACQTGSLIFKEFLPQDFESRLKWWNLSRSKQHSSIVRQSTCLGMAVYIWPQLMAMLLVKLVSFARLSSVYRS